MFNNEAFYVLPLTDEGLKYAKAYFDKRAKKGKG